jgi:sugar lactone lactonase YvrE
VANVTLLPGAPGELPESPVWDAAGERLGWVDMVRGQFVLTDLLNQAPAQYRSLAPYLSAVLPTRAGEWIAVTKSGVAAVKTEGLELITTILPEADHRLNDAACDAQGRLWVGSTADGREGAGALHVYAPGLAPRTVTTGLSLPNGIAWSPDGAILYLADSRFGVVFSAPFDGVAGKIGELSRFLSVEGGEPDGLCVSEDGCVWVACWDGGAVHRYSAAGILVDRIVLPVDRPTSCAFGPDRSLYVTTARYGLSEAQLSRQPHAGRLFRVDTDVSGASVGRYSG